jgi:Meiotically up-regulated gene 113
VSGYVHWDMTAGTLYGVRLPGRAFVKIGGTRNATALRVQQLTYKAVSPLYVLGEVSIPAGLFRVEKRLKTLLAHYVHYGEWFVVDLDTPQFYALVNDAVAWCQHDTRPQRHWYR